MDDTRLIENLIYTYAERIDDGDLEGVAELFRHGEIAAPANDACHTGYDEVLQLYRQSTRIYPQSGTPLTQHVTTNVIIEVDEGSQTAAARSCFTVLQATDELALQPIITGRYRDSFRKIDGQWHFTRREMQVRQLGDLGKHLLFDPGVL